MIRTIQQGERIAEKNAAETQIRRNSPPSWKRQPTIFHGVTHLRIAAKNPAQTQMRPESRPNSVDESEPAA
jgi:hypothetical protein